MEETGCELICGDPATLAVKGYVVALMKNAPKTSDTFSLLLTGPRPYSLYGQVVNGESVS